MYVNNQLLFCVCCAVGTFYKYTGEAEDGYDTCEWLSKQPWCNGSIVTDGMLNRNHQIHGT